MIPMFVRMLVPMMMPMLLLVAMRVGMLMRMRVRMCFTTPMCVFMCVTMTLTMLVFMMLFLSMVVFVIVLMRQMHIKLHPRDARFLATPHMDMPAVEPQLFQLPLQLRRIHPQINQRADQHIAADAAENIQIKRFHYDASALICAAA